MQYFLNLVTDCVFDLLPKKENNNILDSIDFDNENVADIVILLNKYKNNYIVDKKYECNYSNRLSRLKYKLSLCMENPKDTSDLMIKYIRKYKGLTNSSNTSQFDKELECLEKRYNDLIRLDSADSIYELVTEDDKDNSSDNENDNATGKIVKRRIDVTNFYS